MTEEDQPLTPDEIKAIRAMLRDPNEPSEPEQPLGLRERKKRATRQSISDTATMLFLTKGFDAVRVTDVAELCGVSEKTVYNYFPTKESLVLDREDSMIAAVRRALGPDAPEGSPVDAFVDELLNEVTRSCRSQQHADGQRCDFAGVSRFRALVDSNPSLRAAQRDMMERIRQVATEELAARAGVDPDDPEPYVAASAICALWGVMFSSMERQGAKHGDNSDAVVDAIAEDIRRAARLIDTGLWSFGLQVQGRTSQRQVKEAAAAAREARIQVMEAVAAAKDAWWKMTEEMRAFHETHHGEMPMEHWGRGPRGRSRGPAQTEGRGRSAASTSEAYAKLDDAKQEMARAAKDVAKAKMNAKRATRNLKNAAKDPQGRSRPARPPKDH